MMVCFLTASNVLDISVLEYAHLHSPVKACWGQLLQASHNPVVQPTVLYRNQHRKSMRSVCASTKGRAYEVKMPSLKDCQKFKCKGKARATSGSGCKIFLSTQVPTSQSTSGTSYSSWLSGSVQVSHVCRSSTDGRQHLNLKTNNKNSNIISTWKSVKSVWTRIFTF